MKYPLTRISLSVCAALLLTSSAHADDFAAQADQALSQTKPALGDSTSSAQAKCQLLSDQARIRGARVLVIGFEGLASFSAATTTQAYRYHWELSHNLPATPPGASITGFMENGTMVPLIAKLKGAIEVLAFPFSSQSDADGSVPEVCALQWMKIPGRHLVVIGHSFGGDAAVQLVAQLEARNVTVDLAVTEDPVPKTPRSQKVIHVTRNARRWENYYQRVMLPMGVSLPEAAVNLQVRAGHVAVPRQSVVVQSVTARVLQISQLP